MFLIVAVVLAKKIDLLAPSGLRGHLFHLGGPAVLRQKTLRPVTLRPCLSTGLPFLVALDQLENRFLIRLSFYPIPFL